VNLEKLFNPGAVVVFGSMGVGKLGAVLAQSLVSGGFAPVFAVNPKAQGLPGVPGFATMEAIGEQVDLAVIASPSPTVATVLEQCGQGGVQAAVVITSGFSEAGNLEGETDLARIAHSYGIRFVGPNCAGIVNTRAHLFPTLETHPPAGETAFISQSGALGGAVLSWAEEQGLGFSKFASYGNGADLRESELLRYLATDPETKVVALYIESVKDGREFLQAALELTRVKPLVVIKSGRSHSGHRATLSHTGSLAGSDAVYDAAIRQAGAIRVESIEEMFDLCKGFISLPPVHGRRIAIVTNSGGPGVLAADKGECLGLDMAEPSSAQCEVLSAFLPAHASLRNPVDLTVEGNEEGYRRTLVSLLGGADGYDGALALNVNTPYLDPIPLARGVVAAVRETGKPIVANFMAGRCVAAAFPVLSEGKVPNFATGERAMAVLARMAADGETRSRSLRAHQPEEEEQSLPGKGQMLEPEAMAWLKENGLPVPDFAWVHSPREAVVGAERIGYPVVMKVVSPQILHKSDFGGVRLDLRDPETVEKTFTSLEASATGLDFRGVVVYPMIKSLQEVILGLSLDPQFGPVVAFGLGGIYTEIWRDISLRLAPLDREEAAAMVREIKAYPLLAGARGQKTCDLEALVQCLVDFSLLPFRFPEIGEVDLNPVFLLSKGLVVGDVRIIRRSDEHDSH
jgi:acyl-CoA synthetase (NDP forming)